MSKLIRRFFHRVNYEVIILTLLLVLGSIIRLYKVNNPVADWHSWRQADTASVARIYAERGINFLYPKFYDISSIQTGIDNPEGYRMVEFPLYSAIHTLLSVSFKNLTLEVWGRILSSIFALGSGILLYLIGKKILGSLGGLLTAFFYLFIPYNIYFTRVILPEPMGVFWVLLGLYLFLLYKSKDGDLERNGSLLLFASGAAFSLSLLVKPFFALYLVPVFAFFYPRWRELLFKILIFSLIAFLPLILWRFWVSRFPEGIPFFAWAFNGDRIRFHISFWRWIFGERLGLLILGSWGLIPFSISVIKKGEIIVKQLLFGAFAYVSVVATANVRHDYYQIIIIPIICLALSSGIVFLWENVVFNKFMSKLLAVFSVFMMLLMGWYQVKGFYMVNHPEIIEAGKFVDENLPKDAKIVAPYNGDTAFLYQTKRFGWPAVDDSIDNIILRGADYYASVDLGSMDSLTFEKRFKKVVKTDSFIVLDLHEEIKQK